MLRRTRWGAVLNLRRLAAVMIVGALVVVLAFWAGCAVMVGGVLVPGWLGGAALLGGAAAMRLSARFLAARRGGPDVPVDMGAPQTAAAWAAGMCAVLAFSGHVLFGATFTTLRPAAPGGCFLIAQETSFLVAGRGTVWFVRSSGVVAREAVTYTTGDGDRPFGIGHYGLTWPSGGASLTVAEEDRVTLHDEPGETSC